MAPHRGNLFQLMGLGIGRQPLPPLVDGDGRRIVVVHCRPDTHGRGHGEEHGVALVLELASHLLGRAGGDQFTPVHDGHGGGHREGILQPVLGQNDCGAKLPVDLPQRGEEIRGGDGV